MILVDAHDLGASRPERVLFDALSITIASGDRVGVVGVNGAGKSTLLRVLAGADEPETGSLRRGRGVRVGFLEQVPDLPAGKVAETVVGWEGAAALDRLGMGDAADRDTASLSGGEAKRVALARVLSTECDLLVLDEPTNHLDIDAIDWLEDRLAKHRGGLLLVSHDRHLLARLVTRVIELDGGAVFDHRDGYEGYLSSRARRVERAAAAAATRRSLARRELAWLRRGAPARSRKPLARIRQAMAVIDEPTDSTFREEPLGLHLGTPRLGDKVVELHQVSFGFASTGPLFTAVDLLLDKRERLGVVGANGTGKTTLLEVISGRLAPQAGRVLLGPTVRLGYYRQRDDALDGDLRAEEVVAGGRGRSPSLVHGALMERFWFDDDTRRSPVRLLSGGERRRLQLLHVLATQPNVLLLDEPTNDFDLDTLRALEDFLDDWPGALVVVSHDKAFLDRTVTDVIVLDGRGGAGRYPGGYAAWREQRRATRSSAARAAGRATTAAAGERVGQHRSGAGGKAGKRRSPSTLAHLMGGVEAEIAELERRRDEITGAMSGEPTERLELDRLSRELAQTVSELADLEERWLGLAEEAEGFDDPGSSRS